MEVVLMETEIFKHYMSIPNILGQVKWDKKSTGKWLLFSSKRELKDHLIPFFLTSTNDRKIHHIKYAKRTSDKDPFKDKQPVVCFYADKNTKTKVLNTILKTGIPKERLSWKTDKQTYEDWKPGGKLFEQTKKQKKI